MSKRPAGEGSVYQRPDGRWVGEISAGWEDGRRKRRKVVAPTQREAVARLKELTTAVERGSTVAAERLTVAEWLRDWLSKEAAPTVRPRTLADYRSAVERSLIPALGHHRLGKLEPRHLRDFMAARQAAGLSPTTIAYHHVLLGRALKVAEGYGLVERNVARLVSPPRGTRHQFVPWAPDQTQSFLSAVADHRLAALFMVAVATGLRQSEILGLTWPDIDLNGGVLHVRRTLQR